VRGFDAKELGYEGVQPGPDDAIADANYQYAKMARAEMEAGREIPIAEISLTDDERYNADVRYSIEAGTDGLRGASRRRYSLSTLARANYDRIFGRKK
jgi:hypothetical protein